MVMFECIFGGGREEGSLSSIVLEETIFLPFGSFNCSAKQIFKQRICEGKYNSNVNGNTLPKTLKSPRMKMRIAKHDRPTPL